MSMIWQNKSASMQSDVEIIYLENSASLETRRDVAAKQSNDIASALSPCAVIKISTQNKLVASRALTNRRVKPLLEVR